MPTTENFIVKSSNGKLAPQECNKREYFRGGEKEGQARMIISVFGYNQEKTAEKILEALRTAGLENCINTISVSTNDKMYEKIHEV